LGLTIHDAPDYASHNVVGTASLVWAMDSAGSIHQGAALSAGAP